MEINKILKMEINSNQQNCKKSVVVLQNTNYHCPHKNEKIIKIDPHFLNILNLLLITFLKRKSQAQLVHW
jgi:hypothetical protein